MYIPIKWPEYYPCMGYGEAGGVVLPQCCAPLSPGFDSQYLCCTCIWFLVHTCFCRFFSKFSGFPPASKLGLRKSFFLELHVFGLTVLALIGSWYSTALESLWEMCVARYKSTDSFIHLFLFIYFFIGYFFRLTKILVHRILIVDI